MSRLESLKLGALDLKEHANRNLAIGFGVAMLFVLLLIGGGRGLLGSGGEFLAVDDKGIGPTVVLPPIAANDPEQRKYVAQPATQKAPDPPSTISLKGGTGSEGRMGKLVGVTHEITGPPIETWDMIDITDPFGGGNGKGVAIDPGNLEIDSREKIGQADRGNDPPRSTSEEYPDFVPHATPPHYSRSQVTANAVYPPTAAENNLEGRVVLMVYLGKTGSVDRVEVVRSNNPIFDDAAIRAVKQTTFSPATQNGLGITYKLAVTVEFSLNDK